jgi:caffeoyl-CoA O-methyltransferase
VAAPIEITPQRWRFTADYLREVFGKEDAALVELTRDAAREGLPPIAVTAEVGALLQLLASTTAGRAGLELGTLGGYSAIWLARGLAPSGRLITVEAEPRHADFAERQFARAGLAQRVEVVRGTALEVLPSLAARLGPRSLDLVFIDAVKSEYSAYFEQVKPLIAPGGLLLADNVLGSGRWWIDQLDDPDRQAVDQFNRTVAADPDFLSATVPIREGLLIARRVG